MRSCKEYSSPFLIDFWVSNCTEGTYNSLGYESRCSTNYTNFPLESEALCLHFLQCLWHATLKKKANMESFLVLSFSRKAGKGSHQGLNSDPCCLAESWVGARGWVGRDTCICLQLPRDPVSIWQEQASVGYGWFSLGWHELSGGNRSILWCKALPGNSPELLFITFPSSPTSPAHAGARLAAQDGSVWRPCTCYRKKTPCKCWLGCHRGCCFSLALTLTLSSKEGNLRSHAGESSELDKLINTTPGTLSSLSFERKAQRWENIW